MPFRLVVGPSYGGSSNQLEIQSSDGVSPIVELIYGAVVLDDTAALVWWLPWASMPTAALSCWASR